HLVLAREVEHSARREQGGPCEARGRMLEKGAARRGDRAHGRIAVALDVHGGGAPGRVIARLALALEEDDAAARGELVAGGGPCNAGADDEEIALHGALIASRPGASPEGAEGASAAGARRGRNSW